MKTIIMCIMVRIQLLCLSLGGFIWIHGFHLIERSEWYIPLGFICLVFVLYALIPIPHDHEKVMWKDRHRS